MTNKMVIYNLEGNGRVFEFGTDYTDIKIVEGILYVYRDAIITMIFAKGFWKRIEFNRSEV
jgi:hypothetical protein